jgi:hypothetical protein
VFIHIKFLYFYFYIFSIKFTWIVSTAYFSSSNLQSRFHIVSNTLPSIRDRGTNEPYYSFFQPANADQFFLDLVRWIIEPTDATIIRCIFLELNQAQHVSGVIMPIIRRTRTRLVKTSREDAWLCWLWLCGAVV